MLRTNGDALASDPRRRPPTRPDEDDQPRLLPLSERDPPTTRQPDAWARDDAGDSRDGRGKVRLDIGRQDSAGSRPKRRRAGQDGREEESQESALRGEFEQRLQEAQARFEAQRSWLEQQRVDLEKKVESLRNIQVMMEDEFQKKEKAYLQTIANLTAALEAQKLPEPNPKPRSVEAEGIKNHALSRSRISKTDEAQQPSRGLAGVEADESNEAIEQPKDKWLPRQLFERVGQQPRRTNSRSFSQEKTENSRHLNQISIRELDEDHANGEPPDKQLQAYLQNSSQEFDPFEIKQTSQMADLAKRILEQRKSSLSQLKIETSQCFVDITPQAKTEGSQRYPQSVKELRAKQVQVDTQHESSRPLTLSGKKRMFFEADVKSKHEAVATKQLCDPQHKPTAATGSPGRPLAKTTSMQSADGQPPRHGRSSSILPVGHILELVLQADPKDDAKSKSMKQMKKQMAASSISDEVLTPKVHSKLMAISYQKKSTTSSQKLTAQHEQLEKLLEVLESLFREQFFTVQRRLQVLGELEAAGSLEARLAKAKSWVDTLQQVQSAHAPALDLMRRRATVRVHIEQVALGYTDLRQLPDFNRETSSLYSLLRSVNKQVFSYLHKHPATPRSRLPEYFGVPILDLIASDFWEEEYLRRLEGRQLAAGKL